MGIIEIEVERLQFQTLLTAVVRLTTIPEPTLEVLEDDQLITGFQCANVQLADAPSGLEPPPGVLSARVDLTIEYATRAEIEAGAARHSTPAVGWLQISIPIVSVPSEITAKGEVDFPDKISIAVLVIRIDVPGRPLTQRLDRPLSSFDGYPKSVWHGRPLGIVPAPIPDALRDSKAPLVVSGVFQSGATVTIRLATAGQNIHGPLEDRLTASDLDENKWLIRLSPDVFTDKLALALAKSSASLKDGIEVIEAPTVRWTPSQLSAPAVPAAAFPGLVESAVIPGLYAAKEGSWGAEGNFRLKKRRACGDEDVSVTVFTKLIPVPDIENKRLLVYLEISADPDDGTTFTCWWNKLGPVTLVALFAYPLAAVAFGLITYAIAGGELTDGTRTGVFDEESPSGFQFVGGGNNFAIYKLETKLDLGDLEALGATMGYGVSRGDGVVLAGDLNATPAAIGTEHAPVFEPENGLLFGTWAAGYTCGTGWRTAFELQKIRMRNKVVIKGSGQLVLEQTVALFKTSWTRPAQHWSIEPTGTDIGQYVTVTADVGVYTHADDAPTPPGDQTTVDNPIFLTDGRLFLHTDAGLREYLIARIPPPPQPPSLAALARMRVDCMKLVHQRDDVLWLVDPPTFDYGYEPVRHWTINVADALAGTRIVVSSHQAGTPSQPLATTTVEQTGPLSLEVITDSHTEIQVSHNQTGGLPGVRIGQQWLLPTASTPAVGPPARLLFDGDQITATAPAATLSVTTGDGHAAGKTASQSPPAIVALPDGRVAAWHNDQLILAYPFGGTATPHSPARPSSAGHRGGVRSD